MLANLINIFDYAILFHKYYLYLRDMKSLNEQILNRCIHFNGIMNKCCKAGVNYDDFRGQDRPFKFPCLKQGGNCSLSQFPTIEDVEKEVAVIDEITERTMSAYGTIKNHFNNTKQRQGKLPCSCGGELSFSVAELNDHVWARCSKCGVSFNE
jgi:hypothetical protein